MKDISKYIITTAVVILILGIIWYLQTIVIYILLSVVFSLVGQPFVKLFRKIKIGKHYIPTAISALGAMLCMYVLLFVLAALFVPIVMEEAKIISSVNPTQVLNSLKDPISKTETFINSFLPSSQQQSLENFAQTKLLSFFNYTNVTGVFNQLFSTIGNILVAIFSVSFITFFFLRDEKLFYNGVLLLTPSKYENEVKNILAESKRLLIRYFIGLLIEVFLIILLIALGLSLFGIKNAFIIAFFSGIFYVIPYVGPIIGLFIGLCIGISTNLDLEAYTGLTTLIGEIAGVFLTVQLLDGLIFATIIYSNTVRAHPLEIFLILLLAGNIAGVGTMMLAIPAYTVIRVVAKEFFFNFKIVQRLTKNLNN